ncbi:MAG: 2Fe-2S iron-sulfur cluster-binding protein, partial [Chloroflexota bacterium]
MPETAPAHVQIALMPSGRKGQVPYGANLLDAARLLGVELESICGGRQTCGKCQIAVEEGHFPKHAITSSAAHLSPMSGGETSYREKHPMLDGRRLACACEVLGDLLIVVPEESQARKQIIAKAATDRVIEIQPAVRQIYVESAEATLDDHHGDWERLQAAVADQWKLTGLTIDSQVLPTLQPALRSGKFAVTLTLWHDREVLRVQPGYAEGAYGLAVDVGSTTVVAHLCDLRTGAVLSTQATMNPQVKYGEDLMSRVSYAMMDKQGAARLHRVIISALNDLARRAADSAGIAVEDILDVVLAGNTVMHHILLGLDPVELGGAPFALAIDSPLDLKARDLGLKLGVGAQVHVLPCIAGHVGADNVAVQLAEGPHRQDEMLLIVDVGTNAEIVLG